MPRLSGSGWDKRRLRLLLALFFVALSIPSAILAWQAYSRLQWENFRQYQLQAEELLGRIDRRIRDLVAGEDTRAVADYRFLIAEGQGGSNVVQRSPLSLMPPNSPIPGLVGYFELDAEGRFTTPLLPEGGRGSPRDYGIPDADWAERRVLRERLLAILSQEGAGDASGKSDAVEVGSLAEPAPPSTNAMPETPSVTAPFSALGRAAPAVSRKQVAEVTEVREQKRVQAAFERLSEEPSRVAKSRQDLAAGRNIGRVDELRLEQAFDADSAQKETRPPSPRVSKSSEPAAKRRAAVSKDDAVTRVDLTGAVEPEAAAGDPASPMAAMLASEVDPFVFDPVGVEHFVLYRKVWRQGSRYIQGMVIERDRLLRELIETPYRGTVLAGMSRLGIAYEGQILSALGGQQGDRYLSSSAELSGTLLYRGKLPSPLDQLELIFSVTRIPAGTAGSLVIWLALALGLILSAGVLLLYRLGAKQIELNQQQRDFVSAVSHELKTPLTSIRMYSEMLREGWADEERRRGYYDFIHDESERLSRLITNVLQLARMSRDELEVRLDPVSVSRLTDMIESKVATQIEQAGFGLQIDCDEAVAGQRVYVDDDAVAQIMINLVDNAIKFSARAAERRVRIGARLVAGDSVEFTVRDFGSGIPQGQLKKIFRLFYRSENELTRETVGTGIGLALVRRLVDAMDGEVDVVNRDPGAEFRVRFPVWRDLSPTAVADQ